MNGKVPERRFERILVAVDGSPGSDEGFAAAMPLVRLEHPEVTVLHVLEGPDSSFEAPARVAKVCRALRSGGMNAHLTLREGKPAEEIARLAESMDLVVMSTRGNSGLRHARLGSVAEDVLRRVNVPVLVTRAGQGSSRWERLVVALDGSVRGEEILEFVEALALRLQIPVDLIQAAMPPVMMGGLGEVPGVEIIQNPLPYLKNVQARLAVSGVQSLVKPLEGRAGHQILQYLQEHSHSLLCMTTHGRGGLARVVLGSITDEVLREAPCPVLVVRNFRTPQRP